VVEARGQLKNPEEKEGPPLEAGIRRLVKTEQGAALKSPINPITNPNPV
jgi:hypothetical protein